MPVEQLRLLKMVYGALVNLSNGVFPVEFCEIVGIHPGQVGKKFPPKVIAGMDEMLKEITDEISHMQVRQQSDGRNEQLAKQYKLIPNKDVVETFKSCRQSYLEKRQEAKKLKKERQPEDKDDNKDETGIGTLSVYKNLGGHKELFKDLGKKNKEATDEMCEFICDKDVDIGMAQTINAAFLKLVEHNYRGLMEEDMLRSGSELANTLVLSAKTAQSREKVGDLCDFSEMRSQLPPDPRKSAFRDANQPWKIFEEDDFKDEQTLPSEVRNAPVHKLLQSYCFQVSMIIIILASCVGVVVDEIHRNEDNTDEPHWIIVEAVFGTCFAVEFLLKFWDRGLQYFHKMADVFDFFLLIMGWLGVICEIVMTESADLEKIQVLRFARIFRVLRLLRVFRLLSVHLDLGKDVNIEVEYHMHLMTAYVCYSTAHLKAQRDLVIFFGGNAKIDELEEKEIGRCVLQSQTGVYQACQQAMDQEAQLELKKPEIMVDLRVSLLSKRICDAIGKFIDAAHDAGALCERDAHVVRHPVNHYLQNVITILSDLDSGITENHDHGHKKSHHGGHRSTQANPVFEQVFGDTEHLLTSSHVGTSSHLASVPLTPSHVGTNSTGTLRSNGTAEAPDMMPATLNIEDNPDQPKIEQDCSLLDCSNSSHPPPETPLPNQPSPTEGSA
jgi:hypothetical protein